ncbi:MAG: hypothetical protein ACLPXB_14085 [Thiobacillaceae bacterium]
MTLSPHKAGGIALRLALSLPLLFWAAWVWGADYAQVVAPLYKQVLSVVMGNCRFDDIQIIHTYEYLFRVSYVVKSMQVVNGQVISQNLNGLFVATVYSILTHPIVLFAAALAWPGLTWKGRLVRLLISLPVLVLLEAVDLPLFIHSSINDFLARTYDPQYMTSRPVNWGTVLGGGGRYALCIAGAFAAAGLHKIMSRLAIRDVRDD